MSAPISWLSDESFTFNGHEIQKSSFERNFIHGMIADAQRILQDKLLFATSLPEGPLVRIADDMCNTTTLYSFITEPRNAANFSCGFSTLKPRRLAAEDLRRKTCGGRPSRPPHSYDLTSLLLVNMHPYARSLFNMSEEFGPSNRGNIAIITTTLDHSFIHRPLPPEFSTLLVLYLVDVLPFLRRREPAGAAGHEAFIRSNHLFPEGWTHWSEAKYEGILKRDTKQRLGKTLIWLVTKLFSWLSRRDSTRDVSMTREIA